MSRKARTLASGSRERSFCGFKVERDDGGEKVVGGELGGDDSGIIVSESGVTKRWGDEIVGYAFDEETSATLVEFFSMCYHA